MEDYKLRDLRASHTPGWPFLCPTLLFFKRWFFFFPLTPFRFHLGRTKHTNAPWTEAFSLVWYG